MRSQPHRQRQRHRRRTIHKRWSWTWNSFFRLSHSFAWFSFPLHLHEQYHPSPSLLQKTETLGGIYFFFWLRCCRCCLYMLLLFYLGPILIRLPAQGATLTCTAFCLRFCSSSKSIRLLSFPASPIGCYDAWIRRRTQYQHRINFRYFTSDCYFLPVSTTPFCGPLPSLSATKGGCSCQSSCLPLLLVDCRNRGFFGAFCIYRIRLLLYKWGSPWCKISRTNILLDIYKKEASMKFAWRLEKTCSR